MSTTTQILFNSPALHSLKRDQLVKLCKIHSIKASGKNVELVQRLKLHAETLPKDAPLSIAARSETTMPLQSDKRDDLREEEDHLSYRNAPPRPSEQWEVMMDSIQEVEEDSSQGSLSSQRTANKNNGEFGTKESFKSNTVGSSIRALATSLGLKRGTSKPSTINSSSNADFPPPLPNDELSQKSLPSSAIPLPADMPQTDHLTLNLNPPRLSFDAENPLPGHALRPGIPAPPNARLSLGLGLVPSTPTRQAQPTTTIRLVSNPSSQAPDVDFSYSENGTPQLKPFQTTFDITFGSPAQSNSNFGSSALSSWPPRTDEDEDVEMKGVYPTLTFDDLPPSVEVKINEDEDVQMPGGFSDSLALKSKTPEPFLFGSPKQQGVSNYQFRITAASVLEDLNQKLRDEGVDEVGGNIIAKLHPGALQKDSGTPTEREIKPIPSSRRGEITEKFQKLHESEFEKMQGIDEVVKKKAERSPAKDVKQEQVIGKKRKSAAAQWDKSDGPRKPTVLAGRASTTRVISNGRRARANIVPGDFGLEDDDDIDKEDEVRSGKRFRTDSEASPAVQKEVDEMEKEREAIRKKMEVNRARRRSSAVHGGRKSGRVSGRVSGVGGRPRPSVLIKPKPKPSRLGFFSSAKSLVQSVWNRGKPAAPAAPSVPKANVKAIESATIKEKGKMGPPSFMPTKKSSAAPAVSKPTVTAATSSVPSIRVDDSIPNDSADTGPLGPISSTSLRSRSPIPTFNGVPPSSTASSRTSLQSNAATLRGTINSNNSRMGSIPSRARTTSTFGSPRSTGTSRSRISSNAANVSSIGTRLSNTNNFGNGMENVSSMGSRKVPGRPSGSATNGLSNGSITSSNSRLLTPTASSLAKVAKRSTSPASSVGSKLKHQISDDAKSQQNALGVITNNSSLHAVTSPKPDKRTQIFSKPLLLPHQSGIPTPVKKRIFSRDITSPNDGPVPVTANTLTRTRSLNGRKPRISRSKVIARLASQRAAAGGSGPGNRVASGSSVASRMSSGSGGRGPRTFAGHGGVSSGRVRSSLGAKGKRASYAGGGGAGRSAGGIDGNVLMSAKKRVRQSEYLRRRSRMGAGTSGEEGS